MTGQCDVCRLVHGDSSAKEVRHCSLCDAWLCEPCRTSGITIEGVKAIKNRALAAGKRFMERMAG